MIQGRPQYLTHGLQLGLFALVGQLQLSHSVLNDLLFSFHPVSQLPAFLPGFSVCGGKALPYADNAVLDGYHITHEQKLTQQEIVDIQYKNVNVISVKFV